MNGALAGAEAQDHDVVGDRLSKLGLPAHVEHQIRESFGQLVAAVIQQQPEAIRRIEPTRNAEDLRRCLVRAQHLASGLNHREVAVEHLLAVIALDEDGRKDLRELRLDTANADALRAASLAAVLNMPPSVTKDISLELEQTVELQSLLNQSQLLAQRIRVSDHRSAKTGDVLQTMATSSEFAPKKGLLYGLAPQTTTAVVREEAKQTREAINDNVRLAIDQIRPLVRPPNIEVVQNGWPSSVLVACSLAGFMLGLTPLLIWRLW